MGVGPHDLLGVIQMIDHGLPFFEAIMFNDRFLLFIRLQVQAHTDRICFGMKLGTDHIFIKADGHHGSFQRYMGPFLFDG